MSKQLETIIREDTISVPNPNTGRYDTYPHKAKITFIIFDNLDPESGDGVIGELEYPEIHEGFEQQIVRDNLDQIIGKIKLMAGGQS